MKVRDIMSVNVITILEGTPYEEVARILHCCGKSGAPVVDQDGNLIGAVSEKDLFRILYPFYKSYYEHPECYADLEERENKIDEIRCNPVESFMSRDLVTIDSDAPVMRAGALMLSRNINRLPVVENGQLVGIVSRKDIYRRILQNHFGFEDRA